MSEPVSFDPEQYAVLEAAIDEAYKRGKNSVPPQGPKNSFVNCNVTINQSEDSYEDNTDSPDQTPKAVVDEEQGGLLNNLAHLNTPAEVLRMAVSLSQRLQADLNAKNIEDSIHRQTAGVFKDGLNKAHEALVLAAKGDTSVDRIYDAALNLIAYTFVAGHRCGVWGEVSVG